MRCDKSIFSYTIKNHKILKDLSIKYPYVWSGHIKENLEVDYNFDNLRKYKESGFNPIPMIESDYAEELDINKNNNQIIHFVNKLAKNYKFLMVDIEPQLDIYLSIYKAIRKNFSGHISACFNPKINNKIIRYVDRIIPLMYDYGKCIYRYEERVREIIKDLIKLKKEFSLGIPLIASFHEYESVKSPTGKIIETNKHKVLDYAEIVLKIAKEYNVFHNKNFKGIVWWGHLKKPLNKYSHNFYPYSITKEVAKKANALLLKYVR